MRVMVVDDSVVFRSQLKNCLDGQFGINVVGSAAHGRIALEKLSQIDSDLITLDLEMPEMNGFEFLSEMRRRGFTQKVIVFASPTKEGAAQVLEALAAGASDFVAKPQGTSSLDEALDSIRRDLLPKVLQFKKRQESSSIVEAPSVACDKLNEDSSTPKITDVFLETLRPKAIVIASSTGGPGALETIFSSLQVSCSRLPIFIAQHMPAHFTEALARRLESISGISAGEGKNGELVQPNRIYVAPGDFHMTLSRTPDGERIAIKIDQNPKRNGVRPAADYLFETAAREYGQYIAAFVLTGMGEDGKQGAVRVKRGKGAVIIQDRLSSIVWGMPGAVHESGAFDLEGDLTTCANLMKRMIS